MVLIYPCRKLSPRINLVISLSLSLSVISLLRTGKEGEGRKSGKLELHRRNDNGTRQRRRKTICKSFGASQSKSESAAREASAPA